MCPFIPVQGVSVQDCIGCAKEFGRRLAQELDVPVFLYGKAAEKGDYRITLPQIRAGEYEGLGDKVRPFLLFCLAGSWTRWSSSQVDSSFISICLLFVCYSCYSSSLTAHSYENRNGCPISDPATLCRAGVRRRPASGNSSSLTTSTSWEPKSKLTGQAFPFSSASTGHPSTVKLNKSCRVCF